MKKLLVAALFAAALASAPRSAWAETAGIAVRAGALSEQLRASLLKEVTAFRASTPAPFAALRKVRGHKPEVYRELRNPLPLLAVTRELRALGPSALLPMLNELAFEARPREGATEAEWGALREGLLDTVGLLRDRRAAPVLLAAFEQGSLELNARIAAAKGLGRLGGDAELVALTKHLSTSDPVRVAALAGLGECKRIESATALAGLLTQESNEAEAERIARAMGSLASSWAWQAMGPDRQAEGLEVRLAVARSLVPAFARLRAEGREQARKGLLLAEHPDTLALIDTEIARSDAATADALRVLKQRITKTLARR
ncbi:MAG: hypothetical protein MUF64_08335 [Polyangiaceae bacterium]|jgi:hypothetical protein|nr:hypothetical protein [Polyangiaceae bacterium]